MKNKSVVSKILKKIKPYYGYLLLALLSAVISVSLSLYIPYLQDRLLTISLTQAK